MKKEGYDADYAAAVNATASTIGIIIPPSIPMILLGVVASVSIRDLFLGGAIPGVVTGLILMSVSSYISYRRGYPKHERVTLPQALVLTLRSLPALLMPLVIVGGIVLGVFTPTEGAVIAVVYALIVGIAVYRELTWASLREALFETGVQTAVVLLVISTASVISWLLSYNLIPQKLAEAVQSYGPSQVALLAIVAVICLITGTVIDVAPAIILLGSVFAPIAFKLGVDPVHFGVLLVYGMAIGLFTPPVGTTLILSCYIADTTLFKSFKACLPFLIGMLLVLAGLVLFPQFALFLPRLLFP
jgi:tripartite ATP-independent transporter DctM subunit